MKQTPEIEGRRHNSTYPKGGFSCFEDTFVQAESLVLRKKFSAKNPALRVAANRYASPYDNSSIVKPAARKETTYNLFII